jgi:16S rRNA (guanine(966)-N(2))-methyltransferase RsmD
MAYHTPHYNSAMPKSAPLTHTVRIIAGQYRRRLLAVPTLEGLRPTPDRVRQTVFNWLDHWVPQVAGGWAQVRAVDAFAGTGALGFEAASRGAGSVLLCEQQATALRGLHESCAMLGATQCRVQGGDALAMLRSLPPASCDVVFLDPPFHSDWLPKLAAPVAAALSPQGLVYVESAAPVAWAGFTVLRHLKAGAVHAQLLQREAPLSAI